MRPPFRSKQDIIISAPVATVWAYNMDLTRIPEFHPRVSQVDLLSGGRFREEGASYRCHLSRGGHTCVEKDIEIVPLRKVVTALPEDSMGIAKILTDYVVETTLTAVTDGSTRIEISHYYSTANVKAKLLDLVARRKIARDTQAMLTAMKTTIEAHAASAAASG